MKATQKEYTPISKIMSSEVKLNRFKTKEGDHYINIIRRRTDELGNHSSIIEVWTTGELIELKQAIRHYFGY